MFIDDDDRVYIYVDDKIFVEVFAINNAISLYKASISTVFFYKRILLHPRRAV